MSIHLDGYGTSVEYDGETLTLIGGTMQAKIWGTDRIRIPVTDITHIDYRAANPMKNGHLAFTTLHTPVMYTEKTGMRVLPENGLVVHWRRKDQPAFEELYRSLPEPSGVDANAARKAEAEAIQKEWATGFAAEHGQ